MKNKKFASCLVALAAAMAMMLGMTSLAYAEDKTISFDTETGNQSIDLEVNVGDTITVNVDSEITLQGIYPATGSSYDTDAIEVSGTTIKAVKAGKTYVTLQGTSTKGTYVKYCNITVVRYPVYDYKILFKENGAKRDLNYSIVASGVKSYLDSKGIAYDDRPTAQIISGTYYVDIKGCDPLTYADVQGKGGMLETALGEYAPDYFIGISRKAITEYKDAEEFAAEQEDTTPLVSGAEFQILKAQHQPTMELTLAAPKCGDVVSLSTGVEVSTGAQPKVTVAADANYSVFAWEGTPYTFWCDSEFKRLDNTTLKGGESYIAEIAVQPALGWYFSDYTAENVTVNGATLTKVVDEGTDGVFTVYCTVTAVHKWDSGKVTKKPTLKKTGVKTYTCACGETMTKTVAKLKANTMKVGKKTAKVSYSKLAKKKVTLKRAKVITVKKAKGKVTYAKKSGNKKITINKKTGKVTIKKGLKKGTYSVKVKVKAAGTAKYGALTKTVTFKIKIR